MNRQRRPQEIICEKTAKRRRLLQETICDETAKCECCPKQLCMRSKKAKAAIRDWCCRKADLKEEIMGGEWDAP